MDNVLDSGELLASARQQEGVRRVPRVVQQLSPRHAGHGQRQGRHQQRRQRVDDHRGALGQGGDLLVAEVVVGYVKHGEQGHPGLLEHREDVNESV